MTSLKLNLYGNNIHKEGAASLSSTLKNLENLTLLELNQSNNRIGREGVVLLSLALSKLANL